MNITIRKEKLADYPSVRRLNELAIGQPNEADLVDALREKTDPFISLVAIIDNQIVGHIFFSPVIIESEYESFSAMGLAPMAVLPLYQKQRIGGKLIQADYRIAIN